MQPIARACKTCRDEAGRGDFKTIMDKSLESYHVLSVSLLADSLETRLTEDD